MIRGIDLSARGWKLLAIGAGALAVLHAGAGCGAEQPLGEGDSTGGVSEDAIGGETSLWPTTTVPSVTADPDAQAVEVGVKFSSTVAGEITGIRFYKGAGNGGTHTGHLWSASGQKLASVTFTAETASGWQEARFTTPVTLQPGQVYVASYHAPQGHYASTNNYFSTSAHAAGALTALKDGDSGGNGVYHYGGVAFPTSTWQGSSYWVDVLFLPTSSSSTSSSSSGTGGAGSGTASGSSSSTGAGGAGGAGGSLRLPTVPGRAGLRATVPIP